MRFIKFIFLVFLLFFLLVFSAVLSFNSMVFASADTLVGFKELPILSKVDELKLDVLHMSSKIMESKLFTESNFSIYFGTDVIHPEDIESVQVFLDGQLVKVELFNDFKRKITRKGGLFNLFSAVIPDGEHTAKVKVTVNEHGRIFEREDLIPFYKETRSIFIKFLLLDHDKTPPQFVKVVQYIKQDIHSNQEVQKILLENVTYLENLKDYLGAAALIYLAIQRSSDKDADGSLRLKYGKTCLEWNMLNEAERVFKEIATAAGTAKEVRNNAFYYLELISSFKNKKEDIDYYVSLLNKSDDFKQVSAYKSGEAFLFFQDLDKAAGLFKEVTPASLSYPNSLYALGITYYSKGELKTAGEYFLKLRRYLAENNITSGDLYEYLHCSLGFLYLEKGEYEEANEQFKKINANSVIFDRVMFGIGWIYIQKEEFVKGIIAFKDMLEQYPKSHYAPEAMMFIGYGYAKLTSYSKSIEAFNDLVSYSRGKIEGIDKIKVEMSEQAFSDYLQASIISKNANIRMNELNDAIFFEFPELLEDSVFISMLDQYLEFIHIEVFLEAVFQEIVERESKRLFTGQEKGSKKIVRFEDFIRGEYLNTLLNRVKEIKAEYFSQIKGSMDSQLMQLRKRYEEYALEATVRIASNLIQENLVRENLGVE